MHKNGNKFIGEIKMSIKISPSILAADFKVLGEQMKLTADNGAEYIHFDVMDGMFVPSISFGILSYTSPTKPFDNIESVILSVVPSK